MVSCHRRLLNEISATHCTRLSLVNSALFAIFSLFSRHLVSSFFLVCVQFLWHFSSSTHKSKEDVVTIISLLLSSVNTHTQHTRLPILSLQSVCRLYIFIHCRIPTCICHSIWIIWDVPIALFASFFPVISPYYMALPSVFQIHFDKITVKYRSSNVGVSVRVFALLFDCFALRLWLHFYFVCDSSFFFLFFCECECLFVCR